MNAIIYCRVSSKEQVEGTSLESQEMACREYAMRNHMVIASVFVERGESAKFADRTQLLELMAYCGKHANAVEVLLVWKVDRLARNVGDHYNIKAALLKHNVRVVSVTEPIDAKPEGKLLETILAGFAQFDNDLRAARTVQGMRRKLEEGLFPWCAPLGYRSTTRGEKKTQPDIAEQPAFGLLQRAWNEFATGRYTKAEILRLMTGWGLRTRAGKPVSNQSLDQIFRDPFYAGILRDPWSDREHIGLHQPMVSRETFAKVQQVTARRNRSIPHRSFRPEFPLRTFARCAGCEHSLSGSFSRGRSKYYPYYHCLNKQCYTRGNYPQKAAHEEFISFLNAKSPTPQITERIKVYVEDILSHQAGDRHALDEKKVDDIDRIKRQQQELLRLKMEQMITDQEFSVQRSVLVTRLAELEGQRPDQNTNIEEALGVLDEITEPLMDLGSMWRRLPIELQQRFQRWALPAGYVIGPVGTAQKGRLFSLFADYKPSNSTLVPLGGESWNQIAKKIWEFQAILFEASVAEECQIQIAA
ncbi:MAG TPA: recombinase family protein [Acidobacteriaceae bacterium]|nr:recombinase family protein [Acidobacteriaceae bacterium]